MAMDQMNGDAMSGKDKMNQNKPKKGEIKAKFAQQTSLIDALNLVRDGGVMHSCYQHYTSLKKVLDKIAGDWWLSRSDNYSLNDWQETIKFGTRETAHRRYQASFCHVANEDSAMWWLYQRYNPLAIRITIHQKAMERWMNDIQVKASMDRKERQAHLDCIGIQKDVKTVIFGDLVYASVADPNVPRDKHDIGRGERVYWDEAIGSNIEDLQDEIKNAWVTSLVKDSEWRHERESRLTVQFVKECPGNPNAIKIAIPKYVIEDMCFTYSPWLERKYEASVERVLATALSKVGVDPHRKSGERFRRSTLCGGLKPGEATVQSDELGELFDCVVQTLS